MSDEFAGWRKSRRSDANANCVEVAANDCVVGVRDTRQDDAGPVLKFSPAVWRAFVADAAAASRDR